MKTRRKRHNLSIKALGVTLAILILSAVIIWWPAAKDDYGSSDDSTPTASHPSATSFNKHLYPTDKASSIWVVVNKGRVLPAAYAPVHLVAPSVSLRLSAANPEMQLRQEAATALERLIGAAGKQGIQLMLASGYRSYSEQVTVYNSEVRNYGQLVADSESARPGHSEHQTGLAADLESVDRHCELSECFGALPEGRWLADNAYQYGFVIRYQKDQQKLTGYKYEPWHIRYVGQSLATEVHRSHQTLEELFSLPAYTVYSPGQFKLL